LNQSARLNTDTPEFRNWFGESKVVDESGKPMVVYHGTGSTDISEFKVSKGGTYGGGIYLTPDVRGANDYAIYRGAPSSTVYPVYASIKNPASGSEAAQVASWMGEENARDELIKRGYDGVVDMRSGEVVAFYPEQIKSVNNRGTFDPNDANILNQSAGPRMMAVHNLSADNLIFADKLGGLAVPSVGVVTEQAGSVEGFGEITLLGTQSLVDPAKERVFSSDAYTARFPKPEWPKAKDQGCAEVSR
jgi:hypothetical protein